MLSKQQFIDIINHIKQVNDFVNETNTRAKKLNDSIISDFYNTMSLAITFEDDLVKVMENMFNTDLINWWIYELNFGENFKLGCIIESDGITKPDLSTLDKLYDYLVLNLEGGKNEQ